MNEKRRKTIWMLTSALLPVLLTGLLYANSGVGSALVDGIILLATLVFIIMFFIKRPCNELIPAGGYAVSFLLFLVIGDSFALDYYHIMPFAPNRPLSQVAFAAIQRMVIQYLYIPLAFVICLSVGLILLGVRRSKQRKLQREANSQEQNGV